MSERMLRQTQGSIFAAYLARAIGLSISATLFLLVCITALSASATPRAKFCPNALSPSQLPRSAALFALCTVCALSFACTAGFHAISIVLANLSGFAICVSHLTHRPWHTLVCSFIEPVGAALTSPETLWSPPVAVASDKVVLYAAGSLCTIAAVRASAAALSTGPPQSSNVPTNRVSIAKRARHRAPTSSAPSNDSKRIRPITATRPAVALRTRLAATTAALAMVALTAACGRAFRARPQLPPGVRVLAQAEGVSGLVTVVEDSARGVRYMTSDHSVLGGVYTMDGAQGESIFGQFHVHEAVRLARRRGEQIGEVQGGEDGRGLCIGVGVGIVAGSLEQLGTDVDAVEIDPVVVYMAKTYFGLRVQNVWEEDALVFLEGAKDRGRMYDYVVHDVFTGGKVPEEMFAVETFEMIREIMEEDGVLAVNFVGATDVKLGTEAVGAVGAVYRRLLAVFGHVRAFSDEFEENRPDGDAQAGSAVHNIVFFASSVADRVTFRKPVSADIMGSGIRQDALGRFERYELDVEALAAGLNEAGAMSDKALQHGQWVTARVHWRTMRNVFSDELWGAIAM